MVHSEFSPLVYDPTSCVESNWADYYVQMESAPRYCPIMYRRCRNQLPNIDPAQAYFYSIPRPQGPRPVYVVMVRDTWPAVQTYCTEVPGGRKPRTFCD